MQWCMFYAREVREDLTFESSLLSYVMTVKGYRPGLEIKCYSS